MARNVLHLDPPQAQADGEQQQRPQVLPSPTNPMQVARVFVALNFVEDDALTLRYWRDGWWHWKRSHWQEIEYRAVRSSLYRFTENAYYQVDLEFFEWAPNRHKIGDVLEALQAVTILPESTEQPTWLDGRDTGVIVALANGLLDIEQRVLMPPSVRYFNTTAVDFDYNPNAPQPERFLKFLADVWPQDEGNQAAINVVGEWYGYVISGRTDLHKIFLHVGPTRGGKGLMARVLTALLGKRNVAGPTLHSFAGEFGLAPLIGKSLAVISDARFGKGNDSTVVVERLLSISGEDTLTVNRKYRDQWTGKLGARLHVLSNELPRIGDASTAIVGRFIVLMSSKSWLGKEDVKLEGVILRELPGILNWSLDGLQRLVNNNNHFTRTPAFDEAVVEMRDLASPVAAFVRELCVFGPKLSIKVDDLYAAYKSWAEANGHRILSKETFGRDLRACVPGLHVSRPWKEHQPRARIYQGLDVRMPSDGQ